MRFKKIVKQQKKKSRIEPKIAQRKLPRRGKMGKKNILKIKSKRR